MSEQGGGASRSTEPAAGTSSATDISLKEFLMAQIAAAEAKSDAHFAAMEKAVEAAFQASETATGKVEDATTIRFESFNEFNQRIDTILANTATRDALAALGDKLMAEIARNRDDLLALAKRIDLREGQAEGSKLTMGNLVVLITVAVAILGLVIVAANYLAK